MENKVSLDDKDDIGKKKVKVPMGKLNKLSAIIEGKKESNFREFLKN